MPLLLVSYTVVDRDVPRWSAVFYTLAVVCNYPHYMATIYRAYGRDERGQHRLYTHYLTAALVLLGVVAHVEFAVLPWLFTTYVMWSPWHYTGQNFGLLMMFLRRGGVDVTPGERRALYVAFVASFVMLLAAFNVGASSDPLLLSIGLPGPVAFGIEAAAAVTFAMGGVIAFAPMVRRGAGRALLAPFTLYSTQALWFVVPIAVGWMSSLAAPQTRYSSGMLALMHSAQYLWITRYFARRDAEQSGQLGAWSGWLYWGTLVIGGLALFLPVPWLASYGWHTDFTSSVFIVASIVNIHHFMIDGVVWKLRNPRVTQMLVGESGPSLGASATAPRTTMPKAASRTLLLVSRYAAIALLLMLAAVDQWRYRLTTASGDRDGLEAATWINPYDSAAYVRLAQAAGRAGDASSAEAALRRAIATNPRNPTPARALVQLLIESNRLPDAYAQAQAVLASWPDDVETLVNAGVLAYRLNDMAAAEQFWRRALDQDPSQRAVQLYLAERLDARGAVAEALQHYRRYLELAVSAAAGNRPPATEVVPAVLRFADALDRQGDRDAALSQYDLAVRMARQTGLGDIEQIAQARRDAIAGSR